MGERCWVCPGCHWTEWYDPATKHVVCMGEHRDEGLECVEYVPADQLRGALAKLSVVLNDVTTGNPGRVAQARAIVREARATLRGQ